MRPACAPGRAGGHPARQQGRARCPAYLSYKQLGERILNNYDATERTRAPPQTNVNGYARCEVKSSACAAAALL
eukprot:6420727-Prymnesium_polylepis.1